MQKQSIMIPTSVCLLADAVDTTEYGDILDQGDKYSEEALVPTQDADVIILDGNWVLSPHDIIPLPPSLTVSGNLVLNKHVTALPRDLNVKGTLDLSKAVKLRQFPKDAEIKAKKIIIGDAPVTTLPGYLEAKTIDASNSVISKIEPGLIVKNLNLKNCKQLRRLPSNITVKGLLILTGTKVKTLPAQSRINTVDIRDSFVEAVPHGVNIYHTLAEHASNFGKTAYKYFRETINNG